MPELKHTFTGGKMDKDNDERIVANGQYREALNIQVATSEGSDVGAAQNILGNLKQTVAVSGPDNKYLPYNQHVASIVDPITDNVYRFIHTPADELGIWMDRIVEFNTQGMGDPSGGRIFNPYYNEKAVVVDIYKVRTILTGIHTTLCDHEVFLDFTTNVFQMRWGMQLTSIIGSFPNINNWGVYIESIEILDDGTGSTPASIRCKMNVSESDFEVDPVTGARIPLSVALSSLVGQQCIFEADRNLNFALSDTSMADSNLDRWSGITGLNIIDGMLFWTDNYSEPKKINIKRCKQGSTWQSWDYWRDRRLWNQAANFDFGDFDQHTRLVINDENPTDCSISNNICLDDGGGNDVSSDGDNGSDNPRDKVGCTDPTATNYCPLCNISDNNSCLYAPEPSGVCGCTIENFTFGHAHTGSFANEGSFQHFVFGGQSSGPTYLNTTNYDPLATIDDGSCICDVPDQGDGIGPTTLNCYDSGNTVYQEYQTNGYAGAVAEMNSLNPTGQEMYWLVDTNPVGPIVVDTESCGPGAASSPLKYNGDEYNDPPAERNVVPGGNAGAGNAGPGTGPAEGPGLGSDGPAGPVGPVASAGDSSPQGPPPATTFDGGVATGDPVSGVTLNEYEEPTKIPVRGGGYENQTNFTYDCRPVYLEEKHITVIRKGPTAPPTVEMYSTTQPDYNNDGFIDIEGTMRGITSDVNVTYEPNEFNTDPVTGAISPNPNYDARYPNGYNLTGVSKATYSDGSPGRLGKNISIFYDDDGLLLQAGAEVTLNIDANTTAEDWSLNDKLIISGQYYNSFGVKKGCGITGVITNMSAPSTTAQNGVRIRITSISPSTPMSVGPNDIYTVTLNEKEPMFEYKFPRFCYRYKYADGEYSVFGPWSEVAFVPDEFDYLPKKGYNLGMTNRVRSLEVSNFVPKNIPKDVVQVDLLYKESNSPNIYTVESFKPEDPLPDDGALYNYWNSPGTGQNKGRYKVTSELIHAVVPSNQLLRPWDNVPRVAQAQEITANRLIYANYLQNYDTKDASGAPIKPIFSVNIDSIDAGLIDSDLIGRPAKSLKTMRTYQLGVVYRDRYGRETRVMTSESGSIQIPKSEAFKHNRINVSLNNTANGESNYPEWAESYTFYIKETSNEYYNVSMDRWYNADDGNIWLSFPSSERNKINDDTVLILKKQHDNNIPVIDETRYKVVSIKSDAPRFIKTENQYWGSLAMMLPPPGWGGGGKPGGWQSGMFSPSGLPLPNHQYLDIYAEYWDQSVFSELEKMPTCQIRLVQAPGQASNYNPQTQTGSVSPTSNFSKWYDVANISHIGQPPEVIEEETHTYDANGNIISSVTEQVEQPATEVQLVRLTLEKVMGPEVGFAKAADLLDLSRGLVLEARTQIIKDKSQFEGRFFVKVERDAVIENAIIAPTRETSGDWQVLQSREISYLCAAHPGRQDWNHDVYIPIAGEGTYPISFDNTLGHQGNTSIQGHNFQSVPVPSGADTTTEPRLISSYHKYAGLDAPAYASAGQLIDPPNPGFNDNKWGKTLSGTTYTSTGGTVYTWPLGPGEQELEVFMDGVSQSWSPPIAAGGWLTTAMAANMGLKGKTDTISGTPKSTSSTWPSWSNGPAIKNSTAFYNDGAWLPGYGHHTVAGTTFHYGQYKTSLGAVDGVNLVEPVDGWYGLNHYWKPAIWDRGDDAHGGKAYNWDKDTIFSLGAAWYDLAAGRRVHWSWPLTVSWKRWFIDKAGAARGYSGAGIWDEGEISKMDLSFFGIGSTLRPFERTFNLATHQPEELVFADAIGTVGTSFRFKQDPDQTVYTVTDVKTHKVYNYEAPCGTWGYLDGLTRTMGENEEGTGINESQYPLYEENDGWGPNDGASVPDMANRGSGCAKALWPPYGPTKKHPNGLGGKEAFMSDFLLGVQDMAYGTHHLFSGGGPYNRRIRLTLTLDKKIGSGPSGFHPITNHVDESGKANILASLNEKAAASYSEGLTASGGYNSVVKANGALPKYTDATGNLKNRSFYNLNSYWNAADKAGGGETTQPDVVDRTDSSNFYFQNPKAYIGLHERGLNHTTLEIIAPYSGDEADRPMSNNPAVWETEPKEDVGLDIYQAASPTYPINLKRHRKGIDNNVNYDFGDRGEEYIPVGATCEIKGGAGIESFVDGVDGNMIYLNSHIHESSPGTAAQVPLTDLTGEPTKLIFKWFGEGNYYGSRQDHMFVEASVQRTFSNNFNAIEIVPDVHNERKSLSYFNCYSYGNGVESNRIRDDYNAVTIDKGVKASMPLAEQYEEERKASSLIFSGIYNSTSGINRTNQFIQAEPITKDLNPINGSIQKLHTRDTDLVTFCENKVFKILAKKDALFNADGNTNVTSNQAVLGQAIPFSGEYGIAKNPESFASESYRIYFSDKIRGAVLRLSRDGITNISDYGMKDWFKDRLKFANRIVGSFDDRKDEYNLTIETYNSPEPEFVTLQDKFTLGNDKTLAGMSAYTISYTESRKGWVSFKSFIQEDGFSYKNDYYTFPSNIFNRTKDIQLKSPLGFNYGNNHGNAEVWKHHQDIKMRALIKLDVSNNTTLLLQMKDSTSVASDYQVINGMILSGNGIPLETHVTSVNYVTPNTVAITISNPVHVFKDEEILLTAARNNFYNTPSFSSVTVMFNGDQGSVKRFKTLNYEGSQAETTFKENNVQYLYDTNTTIGPNQGVGVGEIYYDNYPKDGWKVESLKTDMQEGLLSEFIDKENKWFNYIRGHADAKEGDLIDTAEFSAQGLGRYESIVQTEDVQGCLDPTAINFAGQGNTNSIDPPANLPCYNCCLYNEGCLDPQASNFDPTADTACEGCCIFKEGCTDPLAFNYDPTAVNDDGSCIYCVYGCTDQNADNYDPNATCGDGSCNYTFGCTDETTIDGAGIGLNGALNYNPLATMDDGSCIYCVYGCTDSTASNYDANATCDDNTCDYCVYGCTGNGTNPNNPNTQTNPGGNNYYDAFGDGSTADNYDPHATCDDGTCLLSGCTDYTSNNYNPNANVDDGSCYSCNCNPAIDCCTDPAAFNYNGSATCDCNGDPIGTNNPGWDDCCQAEIRGCMNPGAVNYLNDNGDGGRDCSGGNLPAGEYPNMPCLTDSHNNTNPANYGCEMPDVTPDTYIRVIQDISASMDPVINPLKAAIVGTYGSPDCLRTDLQDIYANHPNWRQSNCASSLGTSGCSDTGGCDKSCDPKYNGKEAYEAHVSWVAGWEYNVAWAGNISPIHNHGADGKNALIGGFWGASATLQNGDPVNFQNIQSQPTMVQFLAGTGKFSAALNNGTDVLTQQKSMSQGLLSFPAPIEKVYMILITDENAYHYYGHQPDGNHIDAIKLGCITGVGSAGTTTVNGRPATSAGLTSPASQSTLNFGLNNPPINNSTHNTISYVDALGNNTTFDFPTGCGNLRQTGFASWTGAPETANQDQTQFSHYTGLEDSAFQHEGAIVQDIGSLRQQLTALAADGTVHYGAAFMTVKTSSTTWKSNMVDSVKQLFDCLVVGDNPVSDFAGCHAWGDFTGSAFDHSGDGFENVRNIADFQGTTYNGGQGSIKFTVPPTINGISQSNFYNQIKQAMADLGITI